MKPVLHTIIFSLLVSATLFAADDNTDNVETEQTPATIDNKGQDSTIDNPAPETIDDGSQDSTADNQAPKTDNGDLTAPPSDEDFVPSVRITEDLPVAFPVDI
jgi:hypothetical protein